MESFLDLDVSGERVLLLVGEAGIGKTTVWRAAAAAGRERGFLVLSSSASPAETRLAFATIDDLLGPHVDRCMATLPPPQGRALAVALRRVEAEGTPPDPATIAFGITASLRELSAGASVLVAVDDVQWLDEPSAAALAFALRRLGDDRVRFLLAQRTAGEAPLPLGLDRYPEEQLARVEIGPLSLGALGAVLTRRLGTALARPAMRRVHETASGNPLFGIELGRALLQNGGRVEPGEELPVPTSLEELLAARLIALPAATRDALLPAAALRQPAIELLAGVGTGHPQLQPAIDAHVVELDDGRIRFTHPLLAAAVYTRAEPEARHAAHGALAGVAPTVEERARHLALAREPPDEEVACALDDAAGAALAHGSPASAAELAELAARFTETGHEEERLRRQCDTADYHLLAGDARRAYEVAAAIVESAPAGVQRARALFVLSFTEPFERRWAGVGDQALVEAAGADELGARVGAFLALSAIVFKSVREGRSYAARAHELSRSSAARAQSAAMVVLTNALAGLPPDDGMLEEAIELELASGVSLHYGPSTVRALRYGFDDRAEEARAAFDAAERRAAEYGDEVTIASLLFHRAEFECRCGDFALAAKHADEGYALCEQIGSTYRTAVMASMQAAAHGALGDVELARAKAAEASTGTGYWGFRARYALGMLELALGDAGAAAAELRPAAERFLAMGYREAWTIDAVPAAIEAVVELGDNDEAERLLGLYAARVAAGPFGRAATARSRAIVAAARGELDSAFEGFAEAMREHDAIELPFERARTLLLTGRVQRRARQRRRARESLEAALAIFEELGARLWAANARAELGRIGGRASASGELTPSERRIAELVAEGMTNKEVAAALVVSNRTVESALTRIYRKLGVRSRTELARKLAAVRGKDP